MRQFPAKYFVLLVGCITFSVKSYSQDDQESIRRAFQKGAEETEAKRISNLQPKVFINGSLYTDSAYQFQFRTNLNDSVVNRSNNGQVLVNIYNNHFYLRMNSVTGVELKKYAKEQYELTKKNTPAGATNFKLGKLKYDYDLYKGYGFTVSFTSKEGVATKILIRMVGTFYKYALIKMVALFPEDEVAAKKEDDLNWQARSVTTFYNP